MAITIGLKTNTHLLIVSETTMANGIIKIKEDNNPVVNINGVLACLTGDQADTFRTQSYLEQCSKLLSLKYKEKISPELVSRIFSTYLHERLRSAGRLEVQGIIGGKSENNTFKLYGVDIYGTLHEDNFIVTNYGLYFLFGIYDLYYRPDMTETESLNLIRNCLKTLKEKLILETDKWRLDVIGPDGYKTEFVDLNK